LFVCLLKGDVYLKLVVLRGVSYIMAVAKTTVCLVSLDGVWQWLKLNLGGCWWNLGVGVWKNLFNELHFLS
jgi:hypothetical protein